MQVRLQSGDRTYEIAIERQGAGYQASVDGQPFEVEVLDSQPGQISLRLDGRPVTIYWAVDGGEKWVSLGGCAYRLEKPSPRAARVSSEPGGSEVVRAPMPAQVRAVQVEEGEQVEKGQTLLLLEAMKMEIRIKAPSSGQVRKLLVTAGQTVDKEQPLAEVLPEKEAA